jgi:crotonobetainyl-CoA:carnitine CoA-transferase CaiB-like acyl-CoA transferase
MALLDGVRVVEFSRLLAAPLCGLQLAHLGADVIKVESPAGDDTRRFPPYFEDAESGWFALANRGKRSVVLDLADADAVAAAQQLIGSADVVVENLGGALDRFGIAYDRDSDPELVWCSITGLGAGRGGRAVDPSLQARIGLIATTGESGGSPLRVQAPAIDVLTGVYATQAVLCALWQRERGGGGAFLDCAMLDAAATLMGPVAVLALGGHLEPGPIGSESYLVAPSAIFGASDGKHVQLIALTEEHWRAVCTAVGKPEWVEDVRFADNGARLANRSLLHDELAAILATGTAQHWVEAIGAAGAICEHVRDVGDAWCDPLLEERGLLTDARLPAMSLARMGTVAKLSRAPRLGEHTAAVLAEARLG